MNPILSYLSVFLFAISLLFTACSKSSDEDSIFPAGNSNAWLIPQNEVFNGGPGKDGIPSVDQPEFSAISNIDFLADDDLVLGLKVGDDIRAYPHPILDWHEIVNDKVGNLALAITYCPLTGTGIGWNRNLNGTETTFGVSGLLYNSNLIPYDRASDSNWSQMLMQGVHGTNKGNLVQTYPLLEISWKSWKSMFPNSKVLNTNTGFNRSYGVYPYGGYKTNNSQLIFPVNPDDSRLPRKQRGLGIIEKGKARFYPFTRFEGPVTVYQDSFGEKEWVIVGSSEQNFLAAFQRQLPDGTLLEFEAVENNGQASVMRDSEGNYWNLFGKAVSGPREGNLLTPANGFIGYWFSWGAFYPGLTIF